ncbi:MAG: hypothetical protein DMF61_15805 [Blastocatellia bacterium AA13]|nr:MAG: hypothetical protein DMF61_15805 [Blastocatellia bacterium AA13]
MMVRRLHRIIGLALMLPFLAWAITGFVFFVKPGYAGAYEVLSPKMYNLDQAISIQPDSGWLEFRGFKTVLGNHLIVRTMSGWIHLDPVTLQQRGLPSEADLIRLVSDAFSANPSRYGKINTISGDSVTTDTGVEIKVDWSRLSFQQRGKDTARLDLLYRIHYLQWTGLKTLDKILGMVGIALIIILTLLGARLALRGA